tara:strand:- start:892 stop:1125 length:234 start_codon:yes stop_codon:yes gene_type:complete
MSKGIKGDPSIDQRFSDLLDEIDEMSKPAVMRNLSKNLLIKALRKSGHFNVETQFWIPVRDMQGHGKSVPAKNRKKK